MNSRYLKNKLLSNQKRKNICKLYNNLAARLKKYLKLISYILEITETLNLTGYLSTMDRVKHGHNSESHFFLDAVLRRISWKNWFWLIVKWITNYFLQICFVDWFHIFHILAYMISYMLNYKYISIKKILGENLTQNL